MTKKTAKRIAACAMAGVMAAGCLGGAVTVNAKGKVTELNYWTWFPSTDQMAETIEAFEL